MHAVGTFAWAAPEVLLGRPTSEMADVYSFGVLLWELSVREAPSGRHLRPVVVPDEAPAAVVALMDRCLSAEPGDRPTALELVHFFVDLLPGSGCGATAEVAEDGAGGAGGVAAAPEPPVQPRPASGGWLARKRSGGASGGGDEGSGGGGGGAPLPPPAVVPATGFGGGAATAPAAPPASGFGGQAVQPRPQARPGVSGPPARSGEP